jgi:hypothetical protein
VHEPGARKPPSEFVHVLLLQGCLLDEADRVEVRPAASQTLEKRFEKMAYGIAMAGNSIEWLQSRAKDVSIDGPADSFKNFVPPPHGVGFTQQWPKVRGVDYGLDDIARFGKRRQL